MRLKKAIFDHINGLLIGGKTSFADVKEAYPDLTDDTLFSIYLRKAHHDARSSLRKISALKLRIDQLYHSFNQMAANAEDADNIIELMSVNYYRVPPCIMARMVLKSYLSKTLHGTNAIAAGASKFLASPDAIEDKMLAKNITRCIEIDDVYSPRMDVYRREVGLEYERVLEDKLRQANVPFYTEEDMRKMGYPKTPDVCLLEPIAIDGVVIKWIESKAWFGDPISHTAYLRDQYWPYYNRFGPGLVIYWFGLVDEIDSTRSKGIAVMHDLPIDRIQRIESPFLDKL